MVGAVPCVTQAVSHAHNNTDLLFFVIDPKPRAERYTKSMSLKYEPASESLHRTDRTELIRSEYLAG